MGGWVDELLRLVAPRCKGHKSPSPSVPGCIEQTDRCYPVIQVDADKDKRTGQETEGLGDA